MDTIRSFIEKLLPQRHGVHRDFKNFLCVLRVSVVKNVLNLFVLPREHHRPDEDRNDERHTANDQPKRSARRASRLTGNRCRRQPNLFWLYFGIYGCFTKTSMEFASEAQGV